MAFQQTYQLAKEQYAQLGVDTDAVLSQLRKIPVSIHCWQLDDLSGFENPNRGLSGGISATGNAPGKPKNRNEYMHHLNRALSLIPGQNRLALHAIYLDNGGTFVDRDAIEPQHFDFWVEYAREKGIGLDFNPTYFSHPMADDNFTLSSSDDQKRAFWVEHGKRCRKIGAYLGKTLGTPCITNHWIPDGYKDYTIDKAGPRRRLRESMDAILAEPVSRTDNIDSFESKLFGLGIESYTVGSHEYYTNYCAKRDNAIVCMDMGHFHPTETVSSKLSAYLVFGQRLMLHVSRPVRWDSDHVVSFDDETREVMLEIKRNNAFDRVFIGTDYFDASINRVAATVLGSRNVKKAILYALLEPTDKLEGYEHSGDLTRRLAWAEESKTLPFGARLARLDWSLREMNAFCHAITRSNTSVDTMCLSGHRRFPLGSHDSAIRARSLEIMEKAILFCHHAGIRIIQLAGYDVYYEQSDILTGQYFMDGLQCCVDMAATHGIILAFETMETSYMDTVEKAMRCINVISSPFLGIYPDIGNLKNASVLYGTDVCADLCTGKGHIFAAHLKETSPGIYRNMRFGTGHTEYEPCIQNLFEGGVRLFTGEFWCLDEAHWQEDILHAGTFLRKKIEAALDAVTEKHR